MLVLRSANVLEGFNTSPWWAVTTVAALQLETNRKAPHHFKEGGCVRPERKCLEGDMGPAVTTRWVPLPQQNISVHHTMMR